MERTPLLITTSYRGVFFGYYPGADLPDSLPDSIRLQDARNCIAWQNTRGVFGLAARGPTSRCRIGPSVPEITLYGITSVTRCSDEAREAWEAEPWN